MMARWDEMGRLGLVGRWADDRLLVGWMVLNERTNGSMDGLLVMSVERTAGLQRREGETVLRIGCDALKNEERRWRIANILGE
jgi:hypothetical protein